MVLKSATHSVLVASMLLAGAAEVASQPAPTAFRVLRFEEDWSALPDSARATPAGALKRVPLNGDGSVYLSFGGQLRQRGEFVRNFMLGGPGNRDDAFGLTRMLAHADLHAGPARLFVEGKHAMVHGRDLPGGRRTLDHDEFDLQNLFVDLAVPSGSARITFRAGRQELLLGRQRLVSPLDWSNTRRSFEGVRIELDRTGTDVQAFWTRPVQIRTLRPNRREPATDFYGIAATGEGGAWELYLLGLRQTEPIRFAAVEGTQHRVTVGGRGGRGNATTGVRAEVEGGVQGGELADRTIRAWFVATDLSRRFEGVPLTPTLTLGADYASGDGDPGDGRTGTFHQLFPLGHAYLGYTDVLGRQNLVELRGVIEGSLSPRARARVAVHHFERASLHDAVYTVGGSILEPATGHAGRSIGDEFNLSGTFQLHRHTRLEAGYGRFVPATVLLAREGGANPFDWAFVSASFTF
jgi:hypothetical protein